MVPNPQLVSHFNWATRSLKVEQNYRMNRVEKTNVLNPKASLGVVPKRSPSGALAARATPPSWRRLVLHHSDPSLQLPCLISRVGLPFFLRATGCSPPQEVRAVYCFCIHKEAIPQRRPRVAQSPCLLGLAGPLVAAPGRRGGGGVTLFTARGN